MIEDLLQEIVALEKQQEARVKSSVQESKDIVARAKAKANEIAEQTDDKIKAMMQNNLAAAQRDADARRDKIAADTALAAQEIAQKALLNKDKIIADIIGRLEEKYA